MQKKKFLQMLRLNIICKNLYVFVTSITNTAKEGDALGTHAAFLFGKYKYLHKWIGYVNV